MESVRSAAASAGNRDHARRIPRYATSEHLVWLLPIAVLAAALSLYAPRFSLDGPSLVDDWFAITYSKPAVDQIIHGRYESSTVDYGGRYRPAYFIWEYVQWHGVGSPSSALVPKLVGLLKLVAFIAAVALLVVILVRRTAGRGWTVALAALTPAFIVFSPLIAHNFVRSEGSKAVPIVTMTFGLMLLTGAAGALRASPRGRARTEALARFACGYLLYLFSLYFWEGAVAVVALLPALYFWLAADPERGVGSRPLWRSKTILVSAALLLAPIVHLTTAILPALSASNAERESAGGVGAMLGAPALATVPNMIIGTGTPFWFLVFGAVLIAGFRGMRARDREAVLCLGVTAAGSVAAYLSHFAASGLSRYLIPWLVGVAPGGALLLLRLRPRLRVGVLAVGLLSLLVGGPWANVRWWVNMERNGGEAVTLTSSAYDTGCRVYLAGFPGEQRTALARLLRPSADHRPRLVPCEGPSSRAYAVTWSFERRSSPPAGCQTGWTLVERRQDVSLHGCLSFHEPHDTPTQDIGIEAPVRVVRLVVPEEFVPASSLHAELSG